MEDGRDRGDDEDDNHDEARCCRAAKGERVVSWIWVQVLEPDAEEAECGLGQGSPSASLSFGVILESFVTCGTLLLGQGERRKVECEVAGATTFFCAPVNCV